jgi:hypothetical protein
MIVRTISSPNCSDSLIVSSPTSKHLPSFSWKDRTLKPKLNPYFAQITCGCRKNRRYSFPTRQQAELWRALIDMQMTESGRFAIPAHIKPAKDGPLCPCQLPDPIDVTNITSIVFGSPVDTSCGLRQPMRAVEAEFTTAYRVYRRTLPGRGGAAVPGSKSDLNAMSVVRRAFKTFGHLVPADYPAERLRDVVVETLTHSGYSTCYCKLVIAAVRRILRHMAGYPISGRVPGFRHDDLGWRVITDKDRAKEEEYARTPKTAADAVELQDPPLTALVEALLDLPTGMFAGAFFGLTTATRPGERRAVSADHIGLTGQGSWARIAAQRSAPAWDARAVIHRTKERNSRPVALLDVYISEFLDPALRGRAELGVPGWLPLHTYTDWSEGPAFRMLPNRPLVADSYGKTIPMTSRHLRHFAAASLSRKLSGFDLSTFLGHSTSDLPPALRAAGATHVSAPITRVYARQTGAPNDEDVIWAVREYLTAELAPVSDAIAARLRLEAQSHLRDCSTHLDRTIDRDGHPVVRTTALHRAHAA